MRKKGSIYNVRCIIKSIQTAQNWCSFSSCSRGGVLITVCLLSINPYGMFSPYSVGKYLDMLTRAVKWAESFHYITCEISKFMVMWISGRLIGILSLTIILKKSTVPRDLSCLNSGSYSYSQSSSLLWRLFHINSKIKLPCSLVDRLLEVFLSFLMAKRKQKQQQQYISKNEGKQTVFTSCWVQDAGKVQHACSKEGGASTASPFLHHLVMSALEHGKWKT